jgi:hypothetical protein
LPDALTVIAELGRPVSRSIPAASCCRCTSPRTTTSWSATRRETITSAFSKAPE